MPMLGFVGVFKASPTKLLVIVIPADGPSLGTAPSGKCI